MDIDYLDLFWRMKLIELKFALAFIVLIVLILLVVWLVEKWRNRK